MNGKNETLRLNLSYSVLQAFLWMSYAAILGFASVYLLDAGFTNTQIGLMTAAAFAISSLIQPVVAAYADRPESLSVKSLLFIIGGLGLAVALGIWAFRGNRLLTGIFFPASMVVLSVLTPMVNSLATETLNQGKPLNFSVARGIGSAGYALAAFLLGRLEGMVGTVLVPITMALIFGVFLCTLVFFPFTKVRTVSEHTAQDNGGLLAFLSRYKAFAITLVGCSLLYTGHAFLNSYTFQIVESKGGGTEELGVIMAMASFIELPTMFCFGLLRKKAGPAFWLKVAGLFMTLKALFSLLVPNMALFYPVQLLQTLGFALIAVDSVFYANGQVDPRDAVKGQALMTMTLTIGNVLGGLVGGPLIDGLGVNTMLLTAAILSAIGTGIVVWKAGRN